MDPSPSPARATPGNSLTQLIDRFSTMLLREPDDRSELLKLLHGAHERNLVDAEALTIIEGALTVSEMTVRDIMVPRQQMHTLSATQPLAQTIRKVIDSGHSRLPVIGEEDDDVRGIILAKDLLRSIGNSNFRLEDWLRPAMFIPESKPLNVLLREFRISHTHMALVIDEFGSLAGLVTIEDVLEEIVGEIEDEHDQAQLDTDIQLDASGRYRVKAQTPVDRFNEAFSTQFDDQDAHTLGGQIVHYLGRVPRRNESVELNGLLFRVIRADNRRLYSLMVEVLEPPANNENTQQEELHNGDDA
ncbi:MAG: HlyC/CorC family transporter [Fluviibacter sp.]|jgi:magnesium and cobalt transporter